MWGFSFIFSWLLDSTPPPVESPDTLLQTSKETVIEEVYEEDHLELFYLASSILLCAMVFHIVKKNLSYSRKKATFLERISK